MRKSTHYEVGARLGVGAGLRAGFGLEVELVPVRSFVEVMVADNYSLLAV